MPFQPTIVPSTTPAPPTGPPVGGAFDPNQPALPGLGRAPHEALLARGFVFDVRWAGDEDDHFLGILHGEELASGMFVHARDDGHLARGEVRAVFTEDAYRRQGLATALWDVAERLGMQPCHSPRRTDEGDAWARAVGGHLPARQHAEAA